MRSWRTVLIGLVLLGGSAASAQAANLSEFARCLTRAGARFYGTSWCPHCASQRKMFGTAFDEVAYVECSVNGTKDTTEECQAAGITSYPTWTFRDGSRQTGQLSLARLASRTRCPYERGPEPEILDVPVPTGGVLKLPGAEDVEIIEVP